MVGKGRWRRKGQALVEMALILPLLLLLLFGIIEFGRVMSVGLIVTHGAREGARYGAVGATDTEIVNRIQMRSASSLYDSADPSRLTINIERTGPAPGGDIQVQVNYDVPMYMPLVSSFTGNPISVEGVSVMRLE